MTCKKIIDKISIWTFDHTLYEHIILTWGGVQPL